jgi:hypothetical protein
MDIACGFLHPGTTEGLPQSMFPSTTGPRKVCRHWVKGVCSMGNSCGFLHPALNPAATMLNQTGLERTAWQDVERATRESYGQPYASSYSTTMGMLPQMGLNDLARSTAAMLNPYANNRMTQTGMNIPRNPNPNYSGPRRVCRHWERGTCSMGSTCGFLHPNKDGPLSGQLSPMNSNQSETAIELSHAKQEIERLQMALAEANEKKRYDDAQHASEAYGEYNV